MDEHRLDGNAAGGLLGEIFPLEMTTAQVTCASCHAVWRVGQAMVYAHEIGTIVRCATCDNAMIRWAAIGLMTRRLARGGHATRPGPQPAN